jgi:flagellar biosynthesis/type III secretory pathway chaperone
MQATEQLAELIRRKHQVLMQLREIGRRQADLVSGGEIAALLKLLAGKQQLIAGLQALERELNPYYAQNPETRVWRSPADRTRCAQMADECNALLEEIVNLEKQGAEQMDIRRIDVAEQLHQAHAANHVRSAYQAQRRGIA